MTSNPHSQTVAPPPSPTGGRRWALYIRPGAHGQPHHREQRLAAQEEQLRVHLAKLDPTPAEVHVLADRGRAREMLGTIEELVRAGHVDGVLVLRVSCLARDFQSLELFVELCDVHGVHVASCDGFDIRNRVLCATYYAFLEREREEHARAGRRGWELRRREPRS